MEGKMEKEQSRQPLKKMPVKNLYNLSQRKGRRKNRKAVLRIAAKIFLQLTKMTNS